MAFDNNRTDIEGSSRATKGCHLTMGLLSVFDGVMLITILVMALFGNIIVFVAIGKFRVLRSVTNTFIASLSAADLLVSLIPVPMTFAAYVCSWLPENQGGRLQDIAYITCDIMTSAVSIMSLMAVAVDRCIAISSPYKYRDIMSKNKVIVIVVVLWIFCFASAMLRLCIPMKDFTLYIIIVTFIIPVTIMLICYGKIYLIARFQAKKIYKLKRAVRKSAKKNLLPKESCSNANNTVMKKTSFSEEYTEHDAHNNGKTCEQNQSLELSSVPENDCEEPLERKHSVTRLVRCACYTKKNSDEFNDRRRKRASFRTLTTRFRISRYSLSEFNRDLKAAKSLAVIMGTFLLTWTPFMSINIMFYFCPTCADYNFTKYAKILHYTNSAINPILYALLNKKWRAAFTVMLCRSKKVKRPDHSQSELLGGW